MSHSPPTVLERVFEQARQRPEAIALRRCDGTSSLRYGELVAEVNRLAATSSCAVGFTGIPGARHFRQRSRDLPFGAGLRQARGDRGDGGRQSAACHHRSIRPDHRSQRDSDRARGAGSGLPSLPEGLHSIPAISGRSGHRRARHRSHPGRSAQSWAPRIRWR